MNSTGIWYNKTRYKIHIIQYTVHNIKKNKTLSFVVLKVGQGVVEEGLISFDS